MPTKISFNVNGTESLVDDLLNREEKAKLEKDDINISVLDNAQEVEMVFEDPSMVNKIKLEDEVLLSI